MPRRNRPLPAVQLDLFHPSGPQPLDWRCLSTDVREKVTRLIARLLRKHEVCNRPCHTDGGRDDE